MNRINECIEQMQEFIKEIEEKATEHCQQLADNEKLQVEAIATKTIDTINNSIEKLEEMKTQVSDDSQLIDFLQRLNNKCEDVKNFTIIKIEEIKPVIQEEVSNLKEDLEKTFSNFQVDTNKQEETVEEIKEDIKEKVEDTKEEITKVVNEAKEDINTAKNEAIEAIADSIEKILDNENVKNVVKFIIDTKNKAVEIYNLPETQEAINNTKLKIIDIAEKGLDTLKIVLEKDKRKNI